jgi:hypothetical protein
MKPIRQAIVVVDAYRRPSRRRNTAGRYRVGAKTEKEAVSLVRAAIGFGSVEFLGWERPDSNSKKVGYKEIVKEIPQTRLADTTYIQEKPRHACSPIAK